MLASFKKLNKKKDEKHTRIPNELLKVLNQKLPDGLEYEAHANGMCSIKPIGDKNNTISMIVNIPESASKYKNVIKTPADLAEYAYRTQQVLRLNPYEDNTILMNGHRIKVEQLVRFPLNEDKSLKNCEFFMHPPAFNKLDPICLEAGQISLEFQAERKAYDSMHEIFIQLTYKDLIVVDIIIDEKSSQSTLTIHMNATTKNANDLYKVFNFYNYFVKGNIKYKGEKFSIPSNKNGFSFIEKNNIELLRKIVKIENKLNITFEIPMQFSYAEYEMVEQLYTSFVLGKPFKKIKPFNEVTCTGTMLPSENIESIKNKDILLTSCKPKVVELFNQKIELYLLQAIFHMLVKDVEIYDENTTMLKIDDTNPNMFASFRYFTNEESVVKYQQTGDWIKKFEEAKEIQ